MRPSPRPAVPARHLGRKALLPVGVGGAGLLLWWLAPPVAGLPLKPPALALVGALLVAGSAAVMLLAAWRLNLARLRLSAAATLDRVSGLPTRAHFMQQTEREWARSRRYGEDAALLLLDADLLDTVVADHGERCGDALLREVARVATRQLRTSDLPGRVGATQLAVYLPVTDPLGALDAADRIRERVAAALLRWNREVLGTTVSIGVVSAGAGHGTLEALLRDAESALFAARQAGGNCLRAAPLQPRRSLLRGPTLGDRRAQRG